MPGPQFHTVLFYKSNPVCKHFIVLVLVPAFRQRDIYYSIIFVFFILFYNNVHLRLLFQWTSGVMPNAQVQV